MPKKEPALVANDPSRLSLYTKDGKYAGRFPTSFLDAAEGVASGPKNTGPVFGNSNASALVDPYSTKDKAFFEDIFLTDGTAQEALMLLVKFVVGKKVTTVTEPRKQYATEELRKQALESILSKQEYQDLHVQIKEIDAKVKLHERLMSSQAQKYAFGRSVLGIVFKEGRPVELKQFSSKNLGSAYVDKNWKLLGVEYEDILIPKVNGHKQAFKAEDILYFTNLDYNIKPNTLFYGVSKLKPLIGNSVYKRIVTEEDQPEIAKGMWASKAIIPVANVTSQAKLNALSDAFDPGKTNFTNTDIGQPIIIPPAQNILELSESKDKEDIMICRAMGVPIQLVPGFEHITNRATTDSVVQGFMETRVEFERAVLQSQLDTQWYDSLVAEITQKPVEELEWKLALEFQNLVIDTIKERAEALQIMTNAGIVMSDVAKLKFMGMDHLIDEIEDVKQEQEDKETERMEMQAELLNKVPKKPFGKE